jgi:branched-chain amino acid transport system substrate-binding protein
MVSQVFPFERSPSASPLVKEMLWNCWPARKGLPEATPAMLEGFAAAKVLVEGAAPRRRQAHARRCCRRR